VDIEKTNSVLAKAIAGLQSGEVEGLSEMWAVGKTDYDVPAPTKKGKPRKRGTRRRTGKDPLGEEGLSELRMVCKKGPYSTKVNGMSVDSSTACLTVQIAGKLNPTNRAKFLNKLPARMALEMAWELASKSGGVTFGS